MTRAAATTTSRALWIVAAAAMAVGVTGRCFVPLPHGLWEDEIISAVHVVQPFGTMLVDIVRNDVHPPIFVFQLHLWAMAGYGDGWLIANSVLWGLAAVASMYLALRREGRDRALLAAAFLAVSPAGVWMSQELRPYAMLSVFLIWAFHFARRVISTGTPRRADRWWLFGFCVAVIYSHAVSFIGIIALGVYSLALLVRRRADRRRLVQAIVLFGVAGLTALPIIVSSMFHDGNLGLKTTPFHFLVWCAQTIAPIVPGVAAMAAAGIAYLGLAAAGLANRETRIATASFVILPVALAILLSLMNLPLFKPNIFGTLVAPFAAIIAATLCLELRGAARVLAAGILLTGSAVLAFSGGLDRHSVTGYADVARIIRAEARPGDVVWVPQVSYFKGIAWYLDKPDWGSPLAIAEPPSPQWLSVYRRLGPDLVARLHLMPTGQSITAPGGLTIVTGAAYAPSGTVRRVWLVTRPRADLPAGFPPERIGMLARRGGQDVFLLTLSRYDRGEVR